MKREYFYELDPKFKIVSPITYYRLLIEKQNLPLVDELGSYLPFVIEKGESLNIAIKKMELENRPFKIVTSGNNEFCGLVSLREMMDYRVKDESASVSDVMTPKTELKSICLSELEQCSIKKLRGLFEERLLSYCLVTDPKKAIICGVVAITTNEKESRELAFSALPSYEKVLATINDVTKRKISSKLRKVS